MDLLDRLLGHDAWTTRQLLERCLDLSDEQLDREFDLGHRTVRSTFLHIIRNMEVWSALMDEQSMSVIDPSDPELGRSVAAMLIRLDAAAQRLARVARSVSQRDAWDERWVDRLDDPPTEKTYGGALAHIITHSMHHRAQLLHMLPRLGVADLPEGDVLSWERSVGRDT